MARRNPAGGGLGTLLLVGGGALLAAKLIGGKKKTATKPANTGWSLNDLCTQADLVDVARARQDAIAFGGKWGSRPANPTEAEDRLRAYFANRFGACTVASPPETFWDINGNTYFWAGVAQYAWQRSGASLGGTQLATEPEGAQIPQIVGMIVGGPVVA